MKNIRIIFILSLLAVMTGCEYNTPTAMYFQPQKQVVNPTITGMDPSAEALGGVNTITISGTNFSSAADSNIVYFNGNQPEIISTSTTSITVRRPNVAGDSIQVNVVTTGSSEVATLFPYKISSVYGAYGGFLTGVELSALAVDRNENLYVIDKTSQRTLFKIAPDGANTPIGSVSKFVTDIQLTPDGKLILLTNDTRVRRIDLTTLKEDTLAVLPKKVSFGDFDPNGNFYTGGNKTDLYMLKPDLTNAAAGTYASFNIKDIRVYNGYVYVLADSGSSAGSSAKGIWRHSIAGGTLGSKEWYLDWSTTGNYAASAYSAMDFSADGKLIIATDNANPILILNAANPGSGSDILYKGILPTSITQMAWGTENNLYAIEALTSGTTTTWNMLRIDIGQKGAPSFGRE
jgi:hypothetical protein